MSTIRPLTELKRYRQDCSFAAGSDVAFRSDGWTNTILSPVQMRALRATVDDAIVPALVRATRSRAAYSTDELEGFVALLLRNDTTSARRYVSALLRKNVPIDVVFLDLFSGSARHLGELWKRDICTFVDVTIALAALQFLHRDFSPHVDEDLGWRPSRRRAFFGVLPGDQHTFGLSILQEFFRRAGWYVCGGTCTTSEELFNSVCGEPFDVIGLSVSKDVVPEELSSMLRAIKRRIRRPATQILVGGRYFLENPNLVASVGADGTATDALKAVSSFQNA